MAIRLVLVRHGLSSFNAKGLIQGRTDDSVLTDIGYEEAVKAGNALSKIMVYFMGACAAGFIVGGKVPVVVTSRADSSASRIASIAASVIAAQ